MCAMHNVSIRKELTHEKKKPVQCSISKPASETQDEAQDKETPDPLQSTASATSPTEKQVVPVRLLNSSQAHSSH